MTSKDYSEAFVWIWLPGRPAPIVAGRLEKQGTQYIFNYGKSYLENKASIALLDVELPLQSGRQPPLTGLSLAGCLRDGAPDAWGRRVLINKIYGTLGRNIEATSLDELGYLLESGSDRIGALDFQASPTNYEPRLSQNATLTELMDAAKMIEDGTPLTPALAVALQHGTAIGGARPKALVDDLGKKFIAKFSSSTDIINMVKLEFIGMELARACGIQTASTELRSVAGKDVLLVERFDRQHVAGNWHRRMVVSALTLFRLDELMARYASYSELAEIIRHRFTSSRQTLRELYSRMVFNVICGNTDDHARNHAAFWDGNMLTITPAYDICPQPRVGNEAAQAMLLVGQEKLSQLATCLRAAPNFLLDEADANQIIEHQLQTISANWDRVCEQAQLSAVDRNLLLARVFQNPFIFEGQEHFVRTMG